MHEESGPGRTPTRRTGSVRRWIALSAGVLALGTLGACAPESDPSVRKAPDARVTPKERTVGAPEETDPTRGGPGAPVKVALLLPLSGPYQDFGKAMQRAAEMAVFETGGSNFELIPFDTRGTPDGAAAAADQAIAQNAQLILGPLLAGSVRAVRSRTEGTGLNVVAFSNDPMVAGGNVFLISFQPRPEVDRIIAYAASQGVNRIAVLAPQDDYGRRIIEFARESATRHNVSITRTGFYDPNSMDVTKEVQAFADVTGLTRQGRAVRRSPIDFDAVLIPDGGPKLRLVGSLLAYYDIDPDKIHFLGTGRWDDPSIRSEPSLSGGWFSAPPPEMRERFVARYRGAYNDIPPRVASLAYDAVALAATLARSGEGGNVFSAEALASPSGFLGVDGLFRFRSDGTAERGLAVLEVQPEEFRMIGDAPRTFAVIGTN